MACILDGSKLTLSGTVGDDWWGDAFSYSDVLLALAEVDEDADLTVHINSGGGIATEGAAIHSLLANRPGNAWARALMAKPINITPQSLVMRISWR